jgi:tetratricopeptide (TPR) repeat protein
VASAFRRKPRGIVSTVTTTGPLLRVTYGLLLLGSVVIADARSKSQSQSHTVDTRDALQKAALLVQHGRLDEADQQARIALDDPATRAVASSVLGTIRLQQNQLNESASFLETAIKLEPRLLGAHLTLAQVYTLQGKSQEAAAVFRKALELDPSNLTARLALAGAATEKGEYRRSRELAQPVLAAFKESPEGLFILSTNALKTGDRAAATQLIDTWKQLTDVPPAWSVKFALLLTREGIVRDAIGILERVRQEGAISYELAFNLAGAYLLNEEPGRALDSYDAALALQPQSVPALRQAAAIAERQGELDRALSYWLRAKKVDPNDPEILLGFGRVCLKMDLLEDAEPALTAAATLRPEEPAYQYTLAAAKVGKRQFEAAQGLLEVLVAKRPDDSQLQYALGSVLYIQGRLVEASARLRESIRLQPEQLASHYYLALVARDQGNDTEAIQTLEKVLQRYPDHAASYEALGGLLMNVRRYTDAEGSLRNAIRLNPKSVKANYQLGLLLARMGKKEEADKQLELAKSLRQEDETNSRLQLRLLEPDR